MLASGSDFTCLFPLGFHPLTLGEVEEECVKKFPLSSSRPGIFAGLAAFVERLEKDGVPGEIWLDGSFLTEKINPKDIDIVLKVAGAVYDAGTPEQRAAIDWVVENQKLTLHCELYVLFEYPDDHPLHTTGKWLYSYWHRQWGFSREDEPKGIVVLLLSAAAVR